jgi:hypothetical protein
MNKAFTLRCNGLFTCLYAYMCTYVLDRLVWCGLGSMFISMYIYVCIHIIYLMRNHTWLFHIHTHPTYVKVAVKRDIQPQACSLYIYTYIYTHHPTFYHNSYRPPSNPHVYIYITPQPPHHRRTYYTTPLPSLKHNIHAREKKHMRSIYTTSVEKKMSVSTLEGASHVAYIL